MVGTETLKRSILKASPICNLIFLCLSFSFGCSAAQAQTFKSEIWLASEFQLTLTSEPEAKLGWHDFIPDRFRVYTELQEGPVFPEMHQLLWRLGPIWEVTPNFSVATHFTQAANQRLPEHQFVEEHRLEFEPLLRGRLLPWLSWANRQRLEYRIRSQEQRWRYRNRLAFSFDTPDRVWTPFVSSEFFFDLNEGLNQNRSVVGVAWQLNPSIRLNFNYMLRFVKEQDNWNPIHVAFFSLSYLSQESGIFQMLAD
ncbi:hypothetical protein COW36_24395 [bacterium (Candidatus Blackallbacteria) CG17_big_fil_post_rev_8_21_14_2_50_48_46]|uniref:DUF2490 domain-containing protein n=1 Tax=bacterium (Candidatus Blackallbacteria) CG17_big_fil_post_rev_8_21_14_2_50_48_46 TaxID=2014261 RepID=A0A2M7FX36_9BACT|nr:MAG: hypothetical protein COW64_19335 [bacterium (Candidatus Blackallbacteria) CG18_big_fil_WC_8_21_14_2_50_49_26]PIW13810.1 MAG: hypothetical protein COW36_24395 [bacterium (Candidatus Blackallbacteria) CG17_big_fil_post_rev_8_21_14_2_50_48_46]PIW45036.1 MAG: hypothetical protein COW20_22025 [bacterium (Candidatus Blackallbacteria) CG13_big_fil_rev_8_21_14_2_50_49_14]